MKCEMWSGNFAVLVPMLKFQGNMQTQLINDLEIWILGINYFVPH